MSTDIKKLKQERKDLLRNYERNINKICLSAKYIISEINSIFVMINNQEIDEQDKRKLNRIVYPYYIWMITLGSGLDQFLGESILLLDFEQDSKKSENEVSHYQSTQLYQNLSSAIEKTIDSIINECHTQSELINSTQTIEKVFESKCDEIKNVISDNPNINIDKLSFHYRWFTANNSQEMNHRRLIELQSLIENHISNYENLI